LEVEVNVRKTISRIAFRIKQTSLWIKKQNWRGVTANLMMILFILLTSVGAALLHPAAGFIVAGVACGLFGYLLGSD
jgi:hypothetical protein